MTPTDRAERSKRRQHMRKSKPAAGTAIDRCSELASERERDAESQFFKAFRATPSVLVISSMVNGKFLEVNEAFEEILGYRRNEVIGRTSQELNIWHSPDDREKVLKQLAAGQRVRNQEFSFRSKSGRIIIGLYSAEIIDIGNERCVLSLANDITARKKAEEDLLQSEERYRRLYNETPVMLHSIDRRGHLLSVSDFWLKTLGYRREEVIGRQSAEFLTAASRIYATTVVLPEFFRTGVCTEVPYQLVKKNGDIVDVLLSAIAERDDDGHVVRSLAVMIDVSERKRADEEIDRLNTALAARAYELECTNREMEAFNYTVAHDLRKPLTLINGYCQVLRELCGSKLDDQCREYLREAYEGTCRMSRLIDTLLNFSNLTHIELRQQQVDLSAMAREVARELRLSDPQRRVTIRIDDGIMVNGDEALLRLVLENLLGNAWKYSARNDTAIIEFGRVVHTDKPACFVRDNGPGFDMASATKLFLPFNRLVQTQTEEGFGIGLATVERIIHRHGGKVWAEGEPGKGATFYFAL